MSERMTRQQYDDACKRADARMKAENGHSFMTILKTRCIYCGRSPKQKGRCRGWFATFVERLYDELDSPASVSSPPSLP